MKKVIAYLKYQLYKKEIIEMRFYLVYEMCYFDWKARQPLLGDDISYSRGAQRALQEALEKFDATLKNKAYK